MDDKQVDRGIMVCVLNILYIYVCVCAWKCTSKRDYIMKWIRQVLQTVLLFPLPYVIYKQDLSLKTLTNHFGKWVPTEYLPVD